jgi:hypothetical protein
MTVRIGDRLFNTGPPWSLVVTPFTECTVPHVHSGMGTLKFYHSLDLLAEGDGEGYAQTKPTAAEQIFF